MFSSFFLNRKKHKKTAGQSDSEAPGTPPTASIVSSPVSSFSQDMAPSIGQETISSPGEIDQPLLPPKVNIRAIRHGVLRLAIRIGKESINAAQWEVLLSTLTEEERKKVKRFYQEKDRRLALGSLLLQRAVTSWVLDKSFGDIQIKRTERNKPYVECHQSRLPHLNYNVSHHGEWVIIASEPGMRVGVDLVDMRDRPSESMNALEYLEHFRRHLAPSEWDGILALPADDSRYKAFYRVWAVKEAYIKALGHGLSFPIGRLECHVTDTGSHSGLDPEKELSIDGCPVAGWQFAFFDLPPSYVWCTALGPIEEPLAAAEDDASEGVSEEELEVMRSNYQVLSVKDCLPSKLSQQWIAIEDRNGV